MKLVPCNSDMSRSCKWTRAASCSSSSSRDFLACFHASLIEPSSVVERCRHEPSPLQRSRGLSSMLLAGTSFAGVRTILCGVGAKVEGMAEDDAAVGRVCAVAVVVVVVAGVMTLSSIEPSSASSAALTAFHLTLKSTPIIVSDGRRALLCIFCGAEGHSVAVVGGGVVSSLKLSGRGLAPSKVKCVAEGCCIMVGVASGVRLCGCFRREAQNRMGGWRW